MLKRLFTRCMAGALIASAATMVCAQDASKVLRIVPQADLKILDPIWTTAFITRDHGYMIYDTLFGVDAKGVVQPEMVDTYTTSPDGKTWTFTLRKGLAFSDGKPVTSADVIASITRWGKRDVFGQRMFAALQSFDTVDAKSFRMTFKQPFPMVLDALGKPSGSAAFIMPKRVADTSADQQITDYTGSGPYIFKQDEYRPGAKIVYIKNPNYVPRPEPASGTAGGKHVYVDRVEWIVLKDAQTQANAIANGEVDMIEWMPAEQYAAFKSNPKLELLKPTPAGLFDLHLNHLVPPFNNPKIAQAAIMAINQEALMRAQLVNKDLYRTCSSIYPCDSPLASTETAYFTGKPQFAAARNLLKEAGYDGKPVVLMYPSDYAVLNKFPPVMAQLLKQAGFNVDLQAMDWSTLVTRRTSKAPADKGGWNLFITGWAPGDTMNPLFFTPLTGNGEKGWFGWATDDKIEQLKNDYLVTSDPAQRKKIAAAIQLETYQSGILAPLGDFDFYSVIRKGVVSGVVPAPVNVFWNIRKS
ncbi:ABC transporter substrate-binding protein [Paraburkholderia sediminicola]|uniref:ABC transporter substrate-binding protein n=1 Tax=Paraburkholderia sediminicola TaxID=458836 RepID=UPI0038B813C3